MRRARPLLGTLVEIAAEGLPDSSLDRAVNAAFSAVELVHKLMSFHDPDSDLSRLNRHAAIEPVEVHPWTAGVIRRALALFHATDGLFDCAIGAELMRWELLPDHGLAAARSGKLSAVRLVSKHSIVFDAPVAIDLGGIAKGFAVDRAVAVLRRHGVPTAVVNAGGDLRGFGQTAYPIHIRDPLDPSVLQPAGSLRNGAIATSSAAETLCNAYSVIAPNLRRARRSDEGPGSGQEDRRSVLCAPRRHRAHHGIGWRQSGPVARIELKRNPGTVYPGLRCAPSGLRAATLSKRASPNRAGPARRRGHSQQPAAWRYPRSS